jgi:F-type H+-transporting ATPase subunit a
VPFFIALTTFFIWFALIFLKNPMKAFKFFLHSGTNFFIAPLIVLIEIISHFSKFISLAVRLFANMFAGHLLLKAFYSFIFVIFLNASLLNFFYALFVVAFTLFIVALEFLIAFLQAYVALLLIILYISGVRSFSLDH